MRKILELGTNKTNLPYLNQKIILTNTIALMFGLCNINFAVLSYFFTPDLFACQFLFFIAALSVILLNYSGDLMPARLVLCIVCPAIYLIYHVYLLPSGQNFIIPLYSLQLIFWIPVPLLFDKEEKKYLIILTAYHLCLLLTIPYLNSLLEIPLEESLLKDGIIGNTATATTLLGICALLIIVRYINKDLDLKNSRLISLLTKQKNTLEQKQQEIESQNEELRQQQEELRTVNDLLSEQNMESVKQRRMIEGQKMRADALVKSLGLEVSKQTYRLQNMLDDMTKQNEDLKQFSYIISHNIRSPIAHLLGLVSIFNRENMNDPFNQEVLNLLDNSAKNLDTVIRDLTKIIAIRNELNKEKEKIDIRELIEMEKNLLQDAILSAGAGIREELIGDNTVFTIKSYAQSIIHNLLSNAIKYKERRRKLEIVIKTSISQHFLCISIEDNGLGMELNENTRQKLFGLYQRMHDHVEGKGLGLYMVKTQIEVLGGKIEAESELNKGSIFRIYLPKNM